MVAKCKKKLIIANYSAKSNHNEVMLFLEGRLIRPRTVKNVLGVLSQDGEKGIDISIWRSCCFNRPGAASKLKKINPFGPSALC